ncbi:hypothetical protein [Gluconobacter oxydans]|uniref:hypothetical protein n=1 Tax=Gluconobacter oxydans TaxID=442 RepID=UPI000AE2A678|nr:hypothetical protein [Gluconobacter oxydans]
MMGAALLCGQISILLLAAGSARGSGIFFKKATSASYLLGLRLTGCALLGLSLMLQLHGSQTPIIDVITWLGLLSVEMLLAALLCTTLNAKKNPPRRK